MKKPDTASEKLRTREGMRLWPLLVSATVAFAILIALGVWQMQRLAWKQDLIARATEGATGSAIAAPVPEEWDRLSLETLDYRKMALHGRFLPGELYYYASLSEPRGPYGGAGYFVYAPFATGGFTVMVNRGFVPFETREPQARPGSAPPLGDVTIEGLARQPERPNFITPEPDFETRVWFAREPQRMAQSLGVRGPVAPYTLDLARHFTPPSGLPQAGETRLIFRNNHLNYALTWFGLAAVLVVVTAAFVRRSRIDARARA